MKELSFINSSITPKDAWDALSLKDKAEMMKVAVRNGITDLKTIREKYNEFAEGGYLDWKEKASKYKHLDIDNDRTYDYEGWYNENPQRAWDFLNDSPDAHFDDKYKTVYHPTFSTQSKYSGKKDATYNPLGLTGGTWNKQGTVFTMSPDGYRGPVSMDKRKWYLKNAEDNGVQLREADGSLPLFDDIPWGGVLPNVTITGNKFAEGGKLTNEEYDSYDEPANMLPEVVVTGYRPIELSTYYPLGKDYPFTGHSRLIIPIDEITAEKFTGERKPFGLDVDKTMDAEDYNLFTNNCADATLGFLNSMFGTNESPNIFTTPGDVRDFALQRLRGKRVIRNGIDTVLIPRNRHNAQRLSERAIKAYKDNGTTGIFEYGDNGEYIYGGGGSIHIKPENRGKFTALKERTGHSATWFKEHGTPAQKKMATFALNSRHWKHGLGGNLFGGYNPYLNDVKSGGEENVKRFWNILTGQYAPSLIPLELVGTGYGLTNK